MEMQPGDAPIGNGHAPPGLQRVRLAPSCVLVKVEPWCGVLKQKEVPKCFAIADQGVQVLVHDRWEGAWLALDRFRCGLCGGWGLCGWRGLWFRLGERRCGLCGGWGLCGRRGLWFGLCGWFGFGCWRGLRVGMCGRRGIGVGRGCGRRGCGGRLVVATTHEHQRADASCAGHKYGREGHGSGPHLLPWSPLASHLSIGGSTTCTARVHPLV